MRYCHLYCNTIWSLYSCCTINLLDAKTRNNEHNEHERAIHSIAMNERAVTWLELE
jgi:hypothetical protein